MGFILGCGVALGISQHRFSHIYLCQGHLRACYKKTAGAPRAADSVDQGRRGGGGCLRTCISNKLPCAAGAWGSVQHSGSVT